MNGIENGPMEGHKGLPKEPCEKEANIMKDTNGCNTEATDPPDDTPTEDQCNGNKESSSKDYHEDVKNEKSDIGGSISKIEELSEKAQNSQAQNSQSQNSQSQNSQAQNLQALVTEQSSKKNIGNNEDTNGCNTEATDPPDDTPTEDQCNGNKESSSKDLHEDVKNKKSDIGGSISNIEEKVLSEQAQNSQSQNSQSQNSQIQNLPALVTEQSSKKNIGNNEVSEEQIDIEEDSSDKFVDTVSLSEDSDQGNSKQLDGDIILIEDTPKKKKCEERARSSSLEVEEVLEVPRPRRSVRNRISKNIIKCVNLDDAVGESDVELVDVQDPREKDKKEKSKKDKPITKRKQRQGETAKKTSENEPSPPPNILPSLTDDMFVVEAPSFIVPYVYEKPSIMPFREFVDKLEKKLEEENAIKEKARLEEGRVEEERRQKAKQRKEAGDDVDPDGEERNLSQENPETLKETPKKKKSNRRRMPEDDDASWDGSDDSSDNDGLSDVEKVEVIKESEDLELLPDSLDDFSTAKMPSKKTDSYFDCRLGNFFMNIGLNLVQGYVQNDLMKHQMQKLKKEKKSGRNTINTQRTIESLTHNIKMSIDANKSFDFPLTRCKFCSFTTESKVVMEHHLEMPHMKNNLYACNFCEFENRVPHEIMQHMESVHKVKGRLERPLPAHCCVNCTFEDAAKGKLARHAISCAKRFKPDSNCAPTLEWEPPAKIPKMMKSRSSLTSYQTLSRPSLDPMGAGVLKNPVNFGSANVLGMFKGGVRVPLPAAAAPRPSLVSPGPRGNLLRPHTSSVNILQKRLVHQPSLSIMPLPRAAPPGLQTGKNSGTFVICEICDGYIKDLEQLRNHMQWIHKVKIHPKMIYNRPPLNCQKCQFRFFTDQGLERHLLGAHGLVTSSMQEAANKTKDSGRCPICGKVLQCRLLAHVSKEHNMTLKPAHLSYKCTVCTMTFRLYKQFENHVYLTHRVVAKKAIDKDKVKAPQTLQQSSASETRLKNLKINNEITIIPSTAKAIPSVPKATSSKKK